MPRASREDRTLCACRRPPAAISKPILSVRNLSKSFGSIVTQSDISLDVAHTGLHSLIGPNGAGKTTFFNLLTGVQAGRRQIEFEGRSIGLFAARARPARHFAFVPDLSVFPESTVFENVRVAVQAAHRNWFGL